MSKYTQRAPHLKCQHPSKRRGFSLIELLVVLSIISVLAALLFPAFLTVRGKARQAVCASNLRQIGLSMTMYMQDSDGHYPYAVDPIDKAEPIRWHQFPQFEAAIPRLGMLHDVLKPYMGRPSIFQCPADTGFEFADFNHVHMNAWPSSFEKFGSSYGYHTKLAATQATESTLRTPAQVNVLFDGVGNWHGTLVPLEQRYNTLFADGHVKSITYWQMKEAWGLAYDAQGQPY